MSTRPKSSKRSWARTVFTISGLEISLSMMLACGGSNFPPRQLIALVVSPTGAGANQGDTLPFSATGTFDLAPTTQTNLSVQWASSDTSTATIDPNTGAAICIAIGGPVTITASAVGQGGKVQGTGALTCAAPGSGPVKLVPNSLGFSCQYDSAINKCFCSSPELTTLTNSLSTSLTISRIAVSGTAFSESNNCDTSVGAGQSCTITVTWSPKSMTGIVDGSVTISDNDSTSPQTVGLVGLARCAP
jgi:hypothetical protein